MRVARIALCLFSALTLLCAAALGEMENTDVSDMSGHHGEESLTILLIDCGAALYGTPFDRSLVNAAGDEHGLALSLARNAAGPLLGEGQIIILGYNDALRNAENESCGAADSEQLSRQAEKLTSLPESQRRSSDPAGALRALNTLIANRRWAETSRLRLVMLTGGCVNFFREPAGGYNAEDLKQGVDALREAGVEIHAFGYDLSGFETFAGKEDRLITAESFADGEYTAVPVDDDGMDAALRKNYLPAVLSCLAEMGGREEGRVDPDSASVDDLTVFIGRDEVTAAEGDDISAIDGALMLRFPKKRAATAVDSVLALLDGDGDGVMNISPLEAGSQFVLSIGDLSDRITAISDDTDIIGVAASEEGISLTTNKAGSVQIHFSTTDGTDAEAALSVVVVDHRLFVADVPESVSAGDGGVLIATASAGLQAAAEKEITGAWGDAGGDVRLTNDGTSLTADFLAPGRYRIRFWVEDDGKKYHETERIVTVALVLDRPDDISLTVPYFRQQDGQIVKVTTRGEYADLNTLTVSAEPEDLFTAYADPHRGQVYIVPIKAGEGRLAVMDSDGQELTSCAVTIKSLTSAPVFWAACCAIPVCLILFGLFLGLMIKKGK